MIEVQNLTKRYGPFTAVDDVSFRVERGEILGFLGPNGAGKTTTMRILTGYMPATDGKAIVAGFDVFDQPVEAKRRIGYLPETPPLYPDMTVAEYLSFVAKIKGVPSGDRKARIKQVMERTWVAEMSGRTVLEALEGLPAARRPRPGADPQSRRPHPRRADRRPRPETDHRDAAADQGAGRRSHHHPQHAHPPRGLADLRARGHHQPRQGRGDRHARQPDVAAAGLGNDVRPGGRRDQPTPGPRSPRLPGVTRVVEADRRDGVIGYEVDSERGQDVRRDLARTVVSNGFGLLEMRPMRMSLEQIFLSLTTEESDDREAAEAPQEAAAHD